MGKIENDIIDKFYNPLNSLRLKLKHNWNIIGLINTIKFITNV